MEAVRPEESEEEEEVQIQEKPATPKLTPVQQFKLDREAQKTIDELSKQVDVEKAVEEMGNKAELEAPKEVVQDVPEVVLAPRIEYEQVSYPSLSQMPAYIQMDMSGIDKKLLYQKHNEIKQQFQTQMPAQYTSLNAEMDSMVATFQEPPPAVVQTRV